MGKPRSRKIVRRVRKGQRQLGGRLHPKLLVVVGEEGYGLFLERLRYRSRPVPNPKRKGGMPLSMSKVLEYKSQEPSTWKGPRVAPGPKQREGTAHKVVYRGPATRRSDMRAFVKKVEGMGYKVVPDPVRVGSKEILVGKDGKPFASEKEAMKALKNIEDAIFLGYEPPKKG